MIRKKRLRMMFLGLAGLVVAMTAVVFLAQRSLIYYPRRYFSDDAAVARMGLVLIHYQTGEGRQTAFFLPQRRSPSSLPSSLWILFGGNGSLALDWLEFAGRYPDDSAAFLLIDYPGYGMCEGKPSPAAIRESSLSAIEQLPRSLGVDASALRGRLCALGHSLGAAAALQFAAEREVRKIVLISPFASMLDMARRSVGTPLCYLLVHHFDNEARLGEILSHSPSPSVAIFHGSGDPVIPVEMGRALAQRHPGLISYREIARGDHNGIIALGEEAIFAEMRR
jgi:hypothetical protein